MAKSADTALEALVELLAPVIADRVVERIQHKIEHADLVDQKTCGFDAATYVRCARAGEFPAAKVGRRWIARRSDLNAWLDAKRPQLRVVADDNLDDLRRRLGLKGSRRNAS